MYEFHAQKMKNGMKIHSNNKRQKIVRLRKQCSYTNFVNKLMQLEVLFHHMSCQKFNSFVCMEFVSLFSYSHPFNLTVLKFTFKNQNKNICTFDIAQSQQNAVVTNRKMHIMVWTHVTLNGQSIFPFRFAFSDNNIPRI